METGVLLRRIVRTQPAHAGDPEDSHSVRSVQPLVVTVPTESMKPKVDARRAVFLGLFMTLAQIFVAVVLIAPHGPLALSLPHAHPARQLLVREHRRSRIRHDRSADRSQDDGGLERRLLSRPIRDRQRCCIGSLGLRPTTALLVDRAVRGLGFLELLLPFLRIAGTFRRSCNFSARLAIAAHPTAFFLIAGYSESLFLMALLGFMYWSTAEGRDGQSSGRAARHRHVGDSDRRDSLRGLSGGARGF